ncbi:unnamed protein product [Rhizoctonia solani]|uniref:Uncharacterized protein n=1 Tax=Rhizoctonia solani TaxID=456999 RepID=A0A8H3ANM5_9AGAM|nr:unnamed protein product [Rhizoctonia solani]
MMSRGKVPFCTCRNLRIYYATQLTAYNMLFNYILIFVWLHAFVSPVSDGKMPVKLISDAWLSAPDNPAHEILNSNMVYFPMPLPHAPVPISRMPAYSPVAVPIYILGTRKEAKSSRFRLEKRMGRVRAWLDLLTARFRRTIKSSRPEPTRVVHSPTRVLQPELTASPTTAHQRRSSILVNFSALFSAYRLVIAWVLVTSGFTGIILARFVRVARSEANEWEELIDLYAGIEHDSPSGVFESISSPQFPAFGGLGSASTRSNNPVIHSPSPSLNLSKPTSAKGDGTSLIGLEHLADSYTEFKSVVTSAASNAEPGSSTNVTELYEHPGLHNPTSIISSPNPSPEQEYSPEYKLQLGAFITDVLTRQQRGEELQIGDMRLEDYERTDQVSHMPAVLPQQAESTRDGEDGSSLVQEDSKPNLILQPDQSPSPASFVGSSKCMQPPVYAIDPTLVPLSVDIDEIYPNLPTSISSTSGFSNGSHDGQDAANTTLDAEVAFADLCQEIGASVSLFDLSQRLESAGNSIQSDLSLNLASSGADGEESFQSEAASTPTSNLELRESILADFNSTLDNRPSPILSSLFISPPFHFTDQYDALMIYHRRRLEVHFNISVHLVSMEGDRRLICHRMYSCKIYRTEAIGMIGQVLSESLKDATRVVGNCYPEAKRNGATFEVGVRIATMAARHHFDCNVGEWVSLGWEPCECAFQLLVELGDSISPPSPNPINDSKTPTNQPSFWARLWMYQLWDGPGDIFGPRPAGPNRS